MAFNAKGFAARRNLAGPTRLSAALVATLAWVFLVVGGYAALQAAHLAVASGVAHTFGGHRAWRGFALSFGTEFFGHERAPANL